MEIEDATGKKMLAIDVFGKSIKALVDHFMKLAESTGSNIIEMTDIRWVLTVPAISTIRFSRLCPSTAPGFTPGF
jgi:hypothetical protein